MKQKEIKFRAWDNADISVYNSLTDPRRMSFYGSEFDMDDDRNSLIFYTPDKKQAPLGDYNSQERYILMQYTGLKDKNGKEIYEGDIVEIKYSDIPFKIIWVEEKSMFGLKGGDKPLGEYIIPQNETKVIGNIYENKDLLK